MYRHMAAHSLRYHRRCFSRFGRVDDVFDELTVRVKILIEVLRSADGYKRVVSHSEENLLPEQMFYLRNKCLYLRHYAIVEAV